MSSKALPGFRDFYPEELARRAHIFRAWRAVTRRYAFQEYDGPPLEMLDLYTRKSGDEIVGQLYNFTDKGGREVALRPEMTPTFARMVGARANALRKPVRWYSIPQLFRYERAQRGRLREHFQLNVDIVGESGEVADAELLAVAVDTMRELGLTSADVRARVSDRRLATALIHAYGLNDEAAGVVFATFDKLSRTPHEVALEQLTAGLAAHTAESASAAERLIRLKESAASPEALRFHLESEGVAVTQELEAEIKRMERYLSYLEALGVRDWVQLDLSIVRGLAYYTGIVFELFDAKGELRAICGGGRYDTLLKALGGADLPALGFGMGDVVLGELLTERGLWPALPDESERVDFYLVAGNGATGRPYADALKLVTALRGAGFNVNHLLNADRYLTQGTRNQVDVARKSGATAAVYFDEGGKVEAVSLLGKMTGAATCAVDADAALESDASAMQKFRDWLHAQRAGVS